jgi:radical SAM superfamily enzyme YgiQ (UPF0313 family)
MKILFVSPSVVYNNKVNDFIKWVNNKFIFGFGKSLAFPILAALTPKEHDIELVEGGHNEINYNVDYDLVGITAVTQYSNLAYGIADEFRKRGVKVVLGGWHPSALPAEALQHADSVVIGEAEETWPQLLKDAETNNLKPFYMPSQILDPTDIPHPKIDIYPKRKRRISVQATRGCPNKCEFCTIINMKFRNRFRTRPVDNVIEDIELIPNKGFFFIDSSLTINPTYTKELFRKMKKLNKKFYAYGNSDVLVKDDELLRLANEAGCLTWYIGFESVCQESIENINKRRNIVDEYLSTIKKVHDHGMSIMGSFMFGFDHDTLDIFDETDDFIRRSDLDIPVFRILTPFPGTPLFDKYGKEGRILTKDWSKYDLNTVVFQPKNMSPSELEYNINRIRLKQYNIFRSFSRILSSIKLGPDLLIESVAMNNFLMMENKRLRPNP